MAEPLKIQNTHYGLVVPDSAQVKKALAKISVGMGGASPAGGSLVSGVLIPAGKGTPRYVASFHFDSVSGRSAMSKATKKRSQSGDRILVHAHMTPAPSSKPPPGLASLRKAGRTVEWLFEVLDDIIPAGLPFVVDTALQASGNSGTPSAIETVRLLAPPLNSGTSDGLELVGGQYRLGKPASTVGLRGFGWSRDESGEMGFDLNYIDAWETGITDPWTHQSKRAAEHLARIR